MTWPIDTAPYNSGDTNQQWPALSRRVLSELDSIREAFSAELYRVYPAEAFGVVANGQDQTAALNSLLQTVYDRGGGQIVFAAGTYRFDGQITVPNDGIGTWPPGSSNRAIVLRGAGAYTTGWNTSAPIGGTILQFTTGPATGRILTLGAGTLTIEDLTLSSHGASASGPFIFTTATTLRIHRVGFFGRQSTPANCDEDAVVCGAANVDGVTEGDAGDPFQGYGTTIINCGFARIRRGLYGRTYANAIVFRDNWYRHDCGGEAAVEFESYHSSEHCTGNVVAGNQVEMVGYRHFAKLTKAAQTSFVANNLWDFAYTQYSTCSYNAGTNTLTKTGAFAGVVAGETVYVVSGTGVTAGVYTIQTVVDDDNVVLTSDPTASSPSDLVIRVYVARAGIYSLNTSVLSTLMIDGGLSNQVPYVDSGTSFTFNRLSTFSGDANTKSQYMLPVQYVVNTEGGGVDVRNPSGYGFSVTNTSWGKSHYFKQENNNLDLYFRFDASTLMHFMSWAYAGGNNVTLSFGTRAATQGKIAGPGDLTIESTGSGKKVNIAGAADKLAAFGGAGATQQTVSGGTDAEKIASLITALAAYNLIVDGT